MLASHFMDKPLVTQALTHQSLKRSLTRNRQAGHVGWIGAILLVAALLLYGLTLDNGLQPGELEGGDLITHQYAQVQARPSNAPGYPLYTMGGWLWFHSIRGLLHALRVEAPNPIPLLSSYSTLWALIALWLLYQILCRLTRSARQPAGDGRLAGLLCAFYAVTYFFWYYATTTEQYSSAIAQTLGIFYLYLHWQEWQGPNTQAGGYWLSQRTKHGDASTALIGLAFLCGLSLAHMLTVAFMVPPLVIVILWQAPHLVRSLRIITASVVAAFLPLVSYLYVYWRGAAHPEWWGSGQWENPQAWFWVFVSTAQGREELGWGLGPNCRFFDNGFPALIWQELSLPLLLLGLVGIGRLEKRQATLLYGTCTIYLIFCWVYRCGNWFQVILPVYPLLLIGVAAFLHRLRQADRWGRVGYRVGMAMLVIAVGWRFGASLPAADSRNRPTDSAFDRAAVLLAQPVPAHAPVFAAVGDALALQYLSAIWQIRPDVQIVDSREAAHHLAMGRSVYSTWEAAPTLRAELPDELTVTQQAVDPHWIGFSTEPIQWRGASRTPVNHPMLATVAVEAYTFGQNPSSPLVAYRQVIAAATRGVTFTLFWQVTDGLWPEGISISVRLLRGNTVMADDHGGYLQQDRRQPAAGLYQVAPTSNLASNQVIVDPYHFVLPAGAVDQVDQVQILLYRTGSTGFENLAEFILPVAP